MASVPWKKDDAGTDIFDRNLLLVGYDGSEYNRENDGNVDIILKAVTTIPYGATVNMVTNPSNTTAWLLQTLRPDLTVLGHSGTDFVRLGVRTRTVDGNQQPVVLWPSLTKYDCCRP